MLNNLTIIQSVILSLFQGYEGSLLKVTSKNGKTSSPVGFVTFNTRAGAEAAKQDLQVRLLICSNTLKESWQMSGKSCAFFWSSVLLLLVYFQSNCALTFLLLLLLLLHHPNIKGKVKDKNSAVLGTMLRFEKLQIAHPKASHQQSNVMNLEAWPKWYMLYISPPYHQKDHKLCY